MYLFHLENRKEEKEGRKGIENNRIEFCIYLCWRDILNAHEG